MTKFIRLTRTGSGIGEKERSSVILNISSIESVKVYGDGGKVWPANAYVQMKNKDRDGFHVIETVDVINDLLQKAGE